MLRTVWLPTQVATTDSWLRRLLKFGDVLKAVHGLAVTAGERPCGEPVHEYGQQDRRDAAVVEDVRERVNQLPANLVAAPSAVAKHVAALG